MRNSGIVRRSAAALAVALSIPVASAAADWDWTGSCGTAWWAVCSGSECSPGHTWRWNNWGSVVCDPESPQFPGGGDTVHIGGTAIMNYTSATVFGAHLWPTGSLTVENGSQLTVLGALIQNDGELWLKYGGFGGDGVLTIPGYVLLDGAGALRAAGGLINGSGELAVGPQQTLRGASLNVRAALANSGSLIAEGGFLRLFDAPKTNAGLMQAGAGGSLELHTQLTQTTTGRLRADGGAARLLGGASVVGGVLETAGGNEVNADYATVALQDVTNAGLLTIGNGAVAALRNSLTNNGILWLYYGGYAGYGTLRFDNDATIDGAGQVEFVGAVLSSTVGATATIGADQIIHGQSGSIDVALDNFGEIISDVAGGAITLRSAPKVNRNLLEAATGAYLDLSAPITQYGNGRIVADGGAVRFDNCVISGGSLETANGGQIVADYSNVTIQDLANRGALRVGNGGSVTMRGSIENDGALTFYYGGYAGYGHARLDGDVQLSGTGMLVLQEGDVSSANGGTLLNTGLHTVTGAGPVQTPLVNAGIVAPGNGVGVLSAWSSYTQTPAGTLRIELAGASTYDRLAVSGAALLGGTLRVLPVGGFNPQPGNQFVVLTAGALAGEFAAVIGPGRYSVSYANNQVTLTMLNRPGDVNCDGEVNFFDIDPFVIALGGEAVYLAEFPGCWWLSADADCDGDVDFFDIDPFVACLGGDCDCDQ